MAARAGKERRALPVEAVGSAAEAFAYTARYDAAISRWFGRRYETLPQHWVTSWEKELDLTYGENPHQRAALYVESGVRSHVLSVYYTRDKNPSLVRISTE